MKLLKKLRDCWARYAHHHNDFVGQSTLPNGIRLVSQRRWEDNKIRFDVRIDAGSREEPVEKRGMAHFLEHTLFDDGIRQQFHVRKGFLNAFTNNDVISIHGQLENTTENLDFLLATLAKMLGHDVDPDLCEKERRRVLNEIGSSMDDAGFVHANLFEKAFDQNRGYYGVLGTVDSVKSISVGDLDEYKKRWFRGPNIVMGVTGISNHDKFHEIAERHLAGITRQSSAVKYISQWVPVDHRTNNDSTHQTYFSFNFPVPQMPAEKSYIVDMAGFYLNTVVRQRLIDEDAIVYDAHAAAVRSSTQNGYLTITGNTMPDDSQHIAPAVAEVLSIARQDVDEKRLEIAREFFLDGVNARKYPFLAGHAASSMAADILEKGAITTLKDEEAGYRAVTVEQVREFIDTVLDQPPAIVIYGDHSRVHSYDEFVKMIEPNRPIAEIS